MKTLSYLLLFYLVLSAACSSDDPEPVPPADDLAEDGLSYLALGDSYTIGESVSPSESFPVLLAEALEDKGIAVADPTIIARTGWTTTNLKNAIARANISEKEYSLVSLLIGVNNQYQGRNLQEYETEFRELLLMAVDLANGNKEHVVVLSIPDYGYTPFGRSRQATISEEIDAFNAVNERIADSLGVAYFDITPISRRGLSEPDLVASDGLHPSGKMYQQWVDLMDDVVAQLLSQP